LIQTLPETRSTNADLAARIRAGEALDEGFWLVADRQSGGRGRQGRVWESGEGNFMGSTLVRIGAGDPPAQTLAFVAGLATIEALLPYCDGVHLKWPNDVLLNGAKIAGILLEAECDAVIIGVGVNLAVAPTIPDRPTARLPHPVSRDLFAAQLAEHFAEQLARWRAHGTDVLFARWCAAAHPVGAMLAVHETDGQVLSGTFAGLDSDGALLLRLADGSVSAIHAGDVTIRGQ